MDKFKKNKVFVQIGTYNGRDEFNDFVKMYTPSKVILVDPYKPMRKEIFKNYSDIPNVFVESVAITEINKGMVTLVHPENKNPKSTSQSFYNECFSLLPMNDWGTSLKSFEAPSMTFTELCDKYELTHIHFLQIDTEGYDAEIIKSIDFNRIKIDVIRYEDWSFPVRAFTRNGEKYIRYGINGMKKVKQLLTYQGYTVERERENWVAVKK